MLLYVLVASFHWDQKLRMGAQDGHTPYIYLAGLAEGGGARGREVDGDQGRASLCSPSGAEMYYVAQRALNLRKSFCLSPA